MGDDMPDVKRGLHVIETNLGRKLIRVVKVVDGKVQIEKLRATTRLWTGKTTVSAIWLRGMKCRPVYEKVDGDLLAAARKADAKGLQALNEKLSGFFGMRGR